MISTRIRGGSPDKTGVSGSSPEWPTFVSAMHHNGVSNQDVAVLTVLQSPLNLRLTAVNHFATIKNSDYSMWRK